MAGSDKSAKSKAAAAELRRRGIYHGVRLTRPAVNSGGLTMSKEPGSSNYQKRSAGRKQNKRR